MEKIVKCSHFTIDYNFGVKCLQNSFTILHFSITLTPGVNIIKYRKTPILPLNPKKENDSFHNAKIRYKKTAKILVK